MQDSAQKPNPLRPDMPSIPGVSNVATHETEQSQTLLIAILVLAAIAVAGGIGWRVLRASDAKAKLKAAAEANAMAQSANNDLPVPDFSVSAPKGPSTAVTLDQLSAPWSSKKFVFLDSATHESVSAMVIRLPGTAASRSDAYWAFSLEAPYETCDLEYVTNLGELRSQYGYHATHPMVVAGCDGTIYDPLQVGNIPGGAWVRGEVVHGAGIRPPIAINVRVQGRSLIADRIE